MIFNKYWSFFKKCYEPSIAFSIETDFFLTTASAATGAFHPPFCFATRAFETGREADGLCLKKLFWSRLPPVRPFYLSTRKIDRMSNLSTLLKEKHGEEGGVGEVFPVHGKQGNAFAELLDLRPAEWCKVLSMLFPRTLLLSHRCFH